MRITEVELKNFKRFTDLMLNGIPPNARLVLWTGSNDLQRNEFERFYKFFNMKVRYDKTMIVQLNLAKKRLVQTKWFRQQIGAVVNA